MPCSHMGFVVLWELLSRVLQPQAHSTHVSRQSQDLETIPYHFKKELLSNIIQKTSLKAEESCFNSRISHKAVYPQTILKTNERRNICSYVFRTLSLILLSFPNQSVALLHLCASATVLLL